MAGFMVALLSCSVGVSALALLYIALTPLLARRYSETGRYYAWLMLVVGLIVPFRPRFDHSILRLELPVQAITPIVGVDSGAPMAAIVGSTTAQSPAMPATMAGVSWWQIAVAVWLVGAVVFLGYHAIRHWRFAKLAARWREDTEDQRVLTLFREVKEKMGITKQIGLCRCASVGSPMMIGILRPCILLPCADLAGDELRFVLMHELIHYRRRDLWYKCLVLIATAMHWFNPVVHLMARAIGAQCESSCDAEVLRGADADARQRYCETIIGVVRRQSGINTALSTNFYGGKKGIKKRIFSIMDSGRRRAGIAVVCCALLLTLGTGFAFAASAPQASVGATHVETEAAYDPSAAYAKYAQYGLTYDRAADELHFRGELVRYFEDMYPVDETLNSYAGAVHFDERGTIDAHGVRDLSQIVHNADGSYDPSGMLLGVEPYTQAAFDARDVAALKRPSYNTTSASASSVSDAASGGESIASNFVLEGDTRAAFGVYAQFGLTYDGDDVFRYRGKTVRRFVDAGGAMAFTRAVANDYDLSVDLEAIRDADGSLAGLLAAAREEFDERTARIEQAQVEMEQFYKDHPYVSANSAVETSDMGADNTASAASSSVVTEQATSSSVVTEQAVADHAYDTTYATSVDLDDVDAILDAYVGYGVSHDRSGNSWVYNGKPIAFLIDPDLQVYVNFEEDNSFIDFMSEVSSSRSAFLKVVRRLDGSIDGIVEMAAQEAMGSMVDMMTANSMP